MRNIFCVVFFTILGSNLLQAQVASTKLLFGKWRLVKHSYSLDGIQNNASIDSVSDEFVFFSNGKYSKYNVDYRWSLSQLETGNWRVENGRIIFSNLKSSRDEFKNIDLGDQKLRIVKLGVSELKLERVFLVEAKGVSTFIKVR